MSRIHIPTQADDSTRAESKAIAYICGVIASLCLMVACLIISVEINIGDRGFFLEEYKKMPGGP